MKFEEINKDQSVAALLIVGVLFGLLGLPLVLQNLYGIDAIKVAFGVIIVYALINWHLQKSEN